MIRVNIKTNQRKTTQKQIPQGGFLYPTGNRFTLIRVLLRDFLLSRLYKGYIGCINSHHLIRIVRIYKSCIQPVYNLYTT